MKISNRLLGVLCAALCSCMELTAQQQATHDGHPALAYKAPGFKNAAFYAEVTNWQAEPAIAYEAGYEPKQSHKGRMFAAAALAGALAMTGSPEGATGAVGLLGGQKIVYGKLYDTPTQYIFVPAEEKNAKFGWTVLKTAVKMDMDKDGEVVAYPDKDAHGPGTGKLHLQPVNEANGKPEIKSFDEPRCLHEGKKIDPAVVAYLADFNGLQTDFPATYDRLVKQAGPPVPAAAPDSPPAKQ
jgi:hypothetical protein